MTLKGAHLELWVELRDERPAVNPVMAGLLERLSAQGARVQVRVPEAEAVEAGPSLRRDATVDLVLPKSATTLALSRAIADEAVGLRFLNSAAASLAAHDKAWVVARLAAARIPVPITYLATADTRLGMTASVSLGWIAKPVRGLHGAGVTDAPTPAAALAAARAPAGAAWVVDDGTRLLQARIGRRDHEDLKVYVAGSAIFAAWKRWAPDSHLSNEHRAAMLEPATADMVRRAGEALGLSCYGVDLRLVDGEAWIVDVNPFPGYRGFPAAIEALDGEVRRALSEPLP